MRKIRWTLSLLAVAGTLPYLVLKLLWLSGSRIGLTDPDFGESTSMLVANGATMLLEVAALTLALAFVLPFGKRLPAWLVLLPMWVGTGLLAPIVVIVPLQLLTGGPSSGGGEPGPIADWVYAMVYAGFTWQAVFLLAGFVLYAGDRWGHTAGWAGRLASAPPAPRARRAAGVAAAALALGGAALAVQASGPLPPPAVNAAGFTLLTLAGVGGLVTFGRGDRSRLPRWLPTVLVWTGSGAMFAWSAYLLALFVGRPELVGDIDVRGVDMLAELARVAAALLAAAVLTLTQRHVVETFHRER